MPTKKQKKKSQSTQKSSKDKEDSRLQSLEKENSDLKTRLANIELLNLLEQNSKYRLEKLRILERINESIDGLKNNVANIGKILADEEPEEEPEEESEDDESEDDEDSDEDDDEDEDLDDDEEDIV